MTTSIDEASRTPIRSEELEENTSDERAASAVVEDHGCSLMRWDEKSAQKRDGLDARVQAVAPEGDAS